MKYALVYIALLFSIHLHGHQQPAQQKSNDQLLKDFIADQAKAQYMALPRYRMDAIKEAPTRIKDAMPNTYIEQRVEQRAVCMLKVMIMSRAQQLDQAYDHQASEALAHKAFEQAKKEGNAQAEKERNKKEQQPLPREVLTPQEKRFATIYWYVLCKRVRKEFTDKKRSCVFCNIFG